MSALSRRLAKLEVKRAKDKPCLDCGYGTVPPEETKIYFAGDPDCPPPGKCGTCGREKVITLTFGDLIRKEQNI